MHMQPSAQNPSSVALKGSSEVLAAKWVSDVYSEGYGEPGFRNDVQRQYALAIKSPAEQAGNYPQTRTQHSQFGTFERKTEVAKKMDAVERTIDVELSPEVSRLLLSSLSRQAELRGLARAKNTIRHPLATYVAVRLSRSYRRNS